MTGRVQHSTHECPAPGCRRQVDRDKLACAQHWYAIPKAERDAVWNTYRRFGAGSPEHIDAMLAAVATLK